MRKICRRIGPVGIACLAIACGGSDKGDSTSGFMSEPIDLDGDGSPDGKTVDVDGNGLADGVDTDGDGDFDQPLPDGSRPVEEVDDTGMRPDKCTAPIGTYEYTIKPRVVSGDCTANPVPDSVAFFDSTQAHSFTSEGVGCTISATTTENNGCTHTDVLSCADGSSITTVCELNADASQLKCIATNDFVSVVCDLEYEAERISPVGDCTPLGGLYQAEIERTKGGDAEGCAPTQTIELNDGELQGLLENTTTCTWAEEATLGDKGCSLNRAATCPDGDQASLDCEWNMDSTEASCAVVSGACEYSLALVR